MTVVPYKVLKRKPLTALGSQQRGPKFWALCVCSSTSTLTMGICSVFTLWLKALNKDSITHPTNGNLK